MNKKSAILKVIFILSILIIPLVTTGCYTIGSMASAGCPWLKGIDKDNCYKFSAVQDNDKGGCELIEDSAVKSDCYALIEENNKNHSSK